MKYIKYFEGKDIDWEDIDFEESDMDIINRFLSQGDFLSFHKSGLRTGNLRIYLKTKDWDKFVDAIKLVNKKIKWITDVEISYDKLFLREKGVDEVVDDYIYIYLTNLNGKSIYYGTIDDVDVVTLVFENKDIDWEDFDEEESNDELGIGDKVEFVGGNKRHIPQHYTEGNGIPFKMIQHGDVYLNVNYKAEIVNKYKDYYIVRYTDTHNNIVILGFKKESLKKI